MSRNILGFIFALVLSSSALPQPPPVSQPSANPTRKLPEFEVANIKPFDPNVDHMLGLQLSGGGRVVIDGADLKTLMMIAFNVSYWQITGGDASTGTSGYFDEKIGTMSWPNPRTMRSHLNSIFAIRCSEWMMNGYARCWRRFSSTVFS